MLRIAVPPITCAVATDGAKLATTSIADRNLTIDMLSTPLAPVLGCRHRRRTLRGLQHGCHLGDHRASPRQANFSFQHRDLLHSGTLGPGRGAAGERAVILPIVVVSCITPFDTSISQGTRPGETWHRLRLSPGVRRPQLVLVDGLGDFRLQAGGKTTTTRAVSDLIGGARGGTVVCDNIRLVR